MRWTQLLLLRQRNRSLDMPIQRVDEEQIAPALLLHEESDLIAIRREADVTPHHRSDRQHLRDRILVSVRVTAGQIAQQFPFGNVEKNDVDVFLVCRVRGKEIAGWRRYRRDLFTFKLGIDLEGLAVLLRLTLGHERGKVLLAQPGAEAAVELIGGDIERALQRLVYATA